MSQQTQTQQTQQQPAPESPELKYAREKQALAEAAKATAEAQKAKIEAEMAILSAQLPTGEVIAPEGKITSEKASYGAELAAYAALADKAEDIARRVDAEDLGHDSLILIVESLEFSGADAQLVELKARFDLWTTSLPEFTAKINALLAGPKVFAVPLIPPALVAPLILGAVSAAGELVSYFQSDYDIKSREITLQDIALRAMVAGRLRTPVKDPDKPGPVILHNFHRIAESSLAQDLAELATERSKLVDAIGKIQAKLIDPLVVDIAGHTKELETFAAELKALEALTPPDALKIAAKNDEIKKETLLKTKAETKKAELAAVKAHAEALVSAFDAFVQVLTTVPEGGSLSPLASMMARQYLYEEKSKVTHLLYLAVASSGGDAISRKRIGRSGEMTLLGGAATTFVLASVDGRVLTADTLVGSKYTKFELGQDAAPVF